MSKLKQSANLRNTFHWKRLSWKGWQAHESCIRTIKTSFYSSKKEICNDSWYNSHTSNLLSQSRSTIHQHKSAHELRFFVTFPNIHACQLVNRSHNSNHFCALDISSIHWKLESRNRYSKIIHRNLTFNTFHEFVKGFANRSQFFHLNYSFLANQYGFPTLQYDDNEVNNHYLFKVSQKQRNPTSWVHKLGKQYHLCQTNVLNKKYLNVHNNTTEVSLIGDFGSIRRSFHSKSQSPSSSSDQNSKKNSAANTQKNESNQIHQTRMQAFSSQMRSVPNMITMGRICVTPYLSYLIYTHEYQMALLGCTLAAISDYVDGYIAKNHNSVTVLGTYLDPLGDKIIINILAFSLYFQSIIPLWAAGLWLARDIGLMTTTYWFVRNRTDLELGQSVIDPGRTPLKVKPTMISKVNTVLQFVAIGGGIGVGMMDGLGSDYLLALCYITVGTTVLSGFSYVGGSSLVSSKNTVNKLELKSDKKSPDDGSTKK